MATVIFSNMGDTDTEVLKYIWMGMTNVKVVEINRTTENAKEIVNEAIASEHDTLIMCGHGCPSGLFNPSFKNGPFLIDHSNKHLIKANRIIGIWCHAKDFAEREGMRGFWSSMFISNSGEARMNGIRSVGDKSITDQEILFCVRLNKLIHEYVPMKQWIDRLKTEADYSNPVVEFNYNGLRYYKHPAKPVVNKNFHLITTRELERFDHDPYECSLSADEEEIVQEELRQEMLSYGIEDEIEVWTPDTNTVERGF